MHRLQMTLLTLALITVSCRAETESSDVSKVRYSVEHRDIPFKIKDQIPICKTQSFGSLFNTSLVLDSLRAAWTQAEDLIGIDNEIFENSKMFMLNEVSLNVAGEDVLVFDGCLGSRNLRTSGGAVPSNAGSGSQDKRKCGAMFEKVQELRSVTLKADAGCGDSALVAGFATRTTSRQISVVSNWTIKGSTKSYPDSPSTMFSFAVSTVEFVLGGSGSLSQVGAAILPLPEPGKGAVAAIFDQIGQAKLSGHYARGTTIVPYAEVPRNAPQGSMSKLAVLIANNILRPACNQFLSSYGIKAADHGLRPGCAPKRSYYASGCAKDVNLQSRMPIRNCAWGPLQRSVYALAPLPQSESQIDFVTVPNMTLGVYSKVGATTTFRRMGRAFYIGEIRGEQAQKPEKCGAFDAKKFKCIIAKEQTGAFCPKGQSRYLSLSQEDSLTI